MWRNAQCGYMAVWMHLSWPKLDWKRKIRLKGWKIASIYSILFLCAKKYDSLCGCLWYCIYRAFEAIILSVFFPLIINFAVDCIQCFSMVDIPLLYRFKTCSSFASFSSSILRVHELLVPSKCMLHCHTDPHLYHRERNLLWFAVNNSKTNP